MAMMIPNLSETELSKVESKGEIKVYKTMRDELPNSYVVFSQVAWILKNENEVAKDGETDFVICHPHFGYLCIEVKGGGISFESGTKEWFSIDRHKEKHSIKDPIKQAKNAKYSIREKLYENDEWKKSGFSKTCHGHAVFFPDLKDSKSLIRPDMPADLIGTNDNLVNIKKWIDGCFDWWNSKTPSKSSFGQRGLDIFQQIFAKSFSVKLLISTNLLKEEEKRIKLTNGQINVLDILRKKRRAVVSGGAGTGKTILAVEKAKRLANEGFSTLLTCYNRPLADYLAGICRDTHGLNVLSFHQLCYNKIKDANEISGRDLLGEAKKSYPGEDEFDVQLPNALAYSLDINSDKYDAIVCDEGQDFREEFWLPLELMLSSDETSPFYIFYDDNQNLYSRVSTFPISEDIFPLSVNCRNTIQIHTASYKYYEGDPVEHSDLDGQELEFEIANNIEKQAIKIYARLIKLILEEKVEASNISILITDAKHKNDYLDIIKKHPLPLGIKLTENEQREVNSVLITTVNRFKGLESEIVFLWGMDFINFEDYRELIYVGLSRAKSILYIVGSEQTCMKFQTINNSPS